MKILKKFFLVSLFCSLFVVNASALETYDVEFNSSYGSEFNYSYFKDFINQYNINLTQLCKDIYNEHYSSYNYYSCFIAHNGTTHGNLKVPGFTIKLWNSSDYIYKQTFFKDNGSTLYIYTGFSGSNYKYLLSATYDYDFSSNSWAFRTSTPDPSGYDYIIWKKSNPITSGFSSTSIPEDLIYTNIDYADGFLIRPTSQFNLRINGVVYGPNENNILPYDFAMSDNWKKLIGYQDKPTEPTYSYTSKVLDNGNVELTFSFENYDSTDSPYAFTIENEISGEEYGEENHFSSIFPKVIPYGDSYTITIPYDTYLYITLAKYNKVDDSTLYLREEIFTDVIDINNIVFSNPSNPYFSIDYQSKKFIQGRFNNTKNNDSCFVKFSNNSNSRQVSCTESFTINYDFNGFLTFYVKRNNETIYTRNINILGNDSVDYPYITYNVEKQDFYSVVTFNVINDNYDINMSYRYSLDNGATWTDYQLIEKEPFSYSINVFSNSNVIFEIANVRSPNNIIVYDSKSVYVVLDISTASGLNSSTNNLIDKFISLISINDNLINYINLLWNNFKNSKLFLIIMIPFISSIICGIIYLIRRK